MLLRNTIIPLDAHDGTIRFVFLGNYFGHTDVVVKSVKTGQVEASIQNAMAYAENGIVPYPVLEVSGLSEGEYAIYTTDAKRKETSYASNVALTGESMKAQMLVCAKLAGIDSEGLLDGMDLQDGVQTLVSIRDAYLAARSDTKTIALAKLLLQAVALVNRRMFSGQAMSNDSYFASDNAMLLDEGCKTVLRKDVSTGLVECSSSADGIVQMPEQDDHLYFYAEIGSDGVPCGFLFTFRPNPIVYGILKDDVVNSKALYQDAVEKVATMSREEIAFDEADEPYLAILNELQPEGPYLHAPSITVEDGSAIIEFTDDDRKILSLFPENYRLSVNPVELALDEGQRNAIEIPGRDFAVYAYKLNLSSEDYVYWVEDEYGTIVSDIRPLCMKNDYLAQLEVDKERTRELSDRIRQLYLARYRKHLMPFAKANFSSVIELLQDAYSYCESCGAYAQDAASTIIKNCMIWENAERLPDIILGSMQDKVVYGRYATNFFEKPPVYHTGTRTLSMPPESYVLYRIDRYSYSGSHYTNFFRAQSHEATDFPLYDCDFAVFSAIDIRTGRSSGFLLFDFDYKHTGRTKMTRFLIDAKEVR